MIGSPRLASRSLPFVLDPPCSRCNRLAGIQVRPGSNAACRLDVTIGPLDPSSAHAIRPLISPHDDSLRTRDKGGDGLRTLWAIWVRDNACRACDAVAMMCSARRMWTIRLLVTADDGEPMDTSGDKGKGTRRYAEPSFSFRIPQRALTHMTSDNDLVGRPHGPVIVFYRPSNTPTDSARKGSWMACATRLDLDGLVSGVDDQVVELDKGQAEALGLPMEAEPVADIVELDGRERKRKPGVDGENNDYGLREEEEEEDRRAKQRKLDGNVKMLPGGNRQTDGDGVHTPIASHNPPDRAPQPDGIKQAPPPPLARVRPQDDRANLGVNGSIPIPACPITTSTGGNALALRSETAPIASLAGWLESKGVTSHCSWSPILASIVEQIAKDGQSFAETQFEYDGARDDLAQCQSDLDLARARIKALDAYQQKAESYQKKAEQASAAMKVWEETAATLGERIQKCLHPPMTMMNGNHADQRNGRHPDGDNTSEPMLCPPEHKGKPHPRFPDTEHSALVALVDQLITRSTTDRSSRLIVVDELKTSRDRCRTLLTELDRAKSEVEKEKAVTVKKENVIRQQSDSLKKKEQDHADTLEDKEKEIQKLKQRLKDAKEEASGWRNLAEGER